MFRWLRRQPKQPAAETHRWFGLRPQERDFKSAPLTSDQTARFDRFTEAARRVLTLAEEEARRLNHNFVGTEHLLLGLVRESDTMAADMLANLGVDLRKVCTAVAFIIGQGDKRVSGDIVLTPRTKKAIEFAVDEARRLNDSFIGSEHLLIGLLREGEGIAYGVLESLGVTLERARIEVVRSRSGDASLRAAPAMSEAAPDVPLVADEQTRARATSALRVAQVALRAYDGTSIEQTMLASFAIPKLARLLDSLENSAPSATIAGLRDSLLAELGPLRALVEALRAQNQPQTAGILASALSTYAEALIT